MTTLTGTEWDPDGLELDEPQRRRRGRVWALLGGAFSAVAVAGVWLWAANTDTDDAPDRTAPRATATVSRGPISATESWDGTLDRAAALTVISGGQGTITRIADQGATVGRGDVLFRIDEQPVTLLFGAVPMYRDLGPGDSGADVEQLEANLAALGHTGFTADDTYTPSTANAVRTWQAKVGASKTGVVTRRAVVFTPEGGQVDTLRSEVGDVVMPGMAILDLAGTDQVVNLEVDVDDRDQFKVDTKVTVLLPGGDEVSGAVSAATIVEAASEGMDAMESEDTDAEPIVEIEIALDDKGPDELVDAPVEVVVAADVRTDVLLVPINALLARAEGGYGLEVVARDGTVSIVGVETGLFAEGKVEVTSPDIAEGTVVGVAGR